MSMDKDFNQQVIAEFRANQGKVGGYFAGRNLLLLHSTGAKSGNERVSPLVYIRDGEDLVIIASKGGADTHPDWYHNLVANPDVSIEIGEDHYPVRATIIDAEPERSRLYAMMVEYAPAFGEYERATKRVIPVFVLKRR